MAKRLTKADRAIILDLVAKYTPEAVAKIALTGKRKHSGRPPNYRHNVCEVWAHVEWRRTAGPANTVKSVCKELEHLLSKWTVGKGAHPSAETIRGYYYDAQRERESDPAMKRQTDIRLADLKSAMAKHPPGSVFIPLLLIQVPGGLETPMIDRRGRGGRGGR